MAGYLRIAVASAALVAAGIAKAEPNVTIVPLDFSVAEFRAPGSRVAALVGTTDALRGNKATDQPLAVVWGPSGAAGLGLKDGAVVPFALGHAGGDLAALERGRDAIPGSRAQAAGAITVTLTAPSRAPGHETLGSDVHAGEITIVERRPVAPGPDPKPVPQATSHVRAGEGTVFEDRAPRLVDLDGDGIPEVVTVRVDAAGAHLTVIARQGDNWSIRAETPTVGDPKIPLHPAAVADFQGLGHPQIAVVRGDDDHAVLEVWALENGKLAKRGEKAGYANHAPGQAAQDLAVAADIDGDGRPELVIPTADRGALAILSLKGGILERARIPLPAPVTTGVAALGTGAATHILAGLQDGRVADIRP